MPKPRKHKRGRAKLHRSGCLYCKPHKANGVNQELHRDRVRRERADATRDDS